MTSASAGNDTSQETLSEARLRAGTYSLLAALLRSTPSQELLDRLQGIQAETADMPGSGDIGAAWIGLRQAARQADLQTLDDEYHQLFIGIGRGELVPYGSWYLTGFLMEKPLGELRRDLAGLGYERQDNVHEPEDHVAALCEVMALLIEDEDLPDGIQRRFFEKHIGSWMEKFFADLQTAKSASFYRAAGHLGQAFITLEKQYLSMPV